MKESGSAKKGWDSFRSGVFTLVSTKIVGNRKNQIYDVVSTLALIINLTAGFAMTFDRMMTGSGPVLKWIETVTVAFFAADYVMRCLTADMMYPELSRPGALGKYVFSFSGIIDLLSFLPFYLPFFFPAGAAAFRMFRVARIFRLFRINAYYDSLNVITYVIISKKQQLLSSFFILLVLMTGSSLCMYSLEHEAQPEVFSNAFSGIWWSVSTLLTVGYGDIYPVTPAGKLMGILITFMGVGVVAIPTGIISAGFVEQYTRVKRIGELVDEDLKFIKTELKNGDEWCDKAISDLGLPAGILIVAVRRNGKNLIPRGDMVLQLTDTVILAADSVESSSPVNIKEVVVTKGHLWDGVAIRDMDISRQTLIVMVKREGKCIVPRGDLVIKNGDRVFLYSEKRTLFQSFDF